MSALARILVLLSPAFLLGQTAAPRIVIDGKFDDWTAVRRSAVSSGAGFREVRVTHDGRGIYFLIDFGRTSSVTQSADETCRILLDTDGSAGTGATENNLAGVDLVLDLSPLRAQGVAVRSNASAAEKLTSYDIGFVSQPSHAAQRFELRLDRLPRFAGSQFKTKLLFLNSSGAAIGETGIIVEEMSRAAQGPAAGPSVEDPLRRAGSLRVLNWNVSGRNLLERTERFLRVLTALQPDIILFDEITRDATANDLEDLLARLSPGRSGPRWRFVLGRSGGRQRGLVASRFPLAAVKSLEWIEYPKKERAQILQDLRDPGLRESLEKNFAEGVAVAGALIDAGGNPLLAVSLDLICCASRPAGIEDHIREMEVGAIHAAIKRTLAERRPSAALVAGDFNLVGLRAPLDAMRRALDVDGSDLGTTDPLRLDGLSNVTWFQHGSRFPPARLDYLLYSDSSLVVRNTFVFNARDLTERWRAAHKLQAEDSESASDHFPVVTDLEWRKTRPAVRSR